MKIPMQDLFRCLSALSVVAAGGAAQAAVDPAPKQGEWVARDFKFNTGQVLPERRLAYSTVGNPAGEPVPVLHGTTGLAASMLNPNFACELVGPVQCLNAPFNGDANDHLYQWESSRDYDPSPHVERIQATLMAINSPDDERKPTERGLLDREMRRVKNGRVLLIPGSPDTASHGTTGRAVFWKAELATLLQATPRGPR